MAKAEISWKRVTDEGVKLQVYAQHIGRDWKFFHREKRYDVWQPVPEPPLEDLLVVCDDVNLPLGKLRVRGRGSHGGHNGLRDIQTHLGAAQYSRLRVGVGAPDEKDLIDHVLGRFRPAEKDVMDDAVGLAAQAVTVWLNRGVEACMNQYNG